MKNITKVLIVILILITPSLTYSQDDCKKMITKNETDKIKNQKTVETKWIAYNRNLTTSQTIHFELFSNFILVWFSSTEEYAIDKGNELGILFENEESILLKFEKSNTIKTFGNAKIYENYVYLNSRKDIEKFNNLKIVKVRQYSMDKDFDVKDNKSLEIKNSFNCLMSEIDTNNLNIDTNDNSENNINNDLSESNLLDTAEYTFRETLWGMSIDEVIKKEGEPDVKDATMLIYNDKYIGKKHCSIGFVFSDNKLVRAKYLFDEKHSNKNLYLDDFEDISKLLVMKYGKSHNEGEVWKNELFKDDEDSYGLAVSKGDLILYQKWRLKRTNIVHIMDGDNFKTIHEIEYSSTLIEESNEDYKDF